jgi:hypothetical protein
MATKTHNIEFGPDRLVITLDKLPKGSVSFSVCSMAVTGRVGDKLLLDRGKGSVVLLEVSQAGVVNLVNGVEFSEDLCPFIFKWQPKDADPAARTSKRMKLETNNWVAILYLRLQMRVAEVTVKGIHCCVACFHIYDWTLCRKIPFVAGAYGQ